MIARHHLLLSPDDHTVDMVAASRALAIAWKTSSGFVSTSAWKNLPSSMAEYRASASLKNFAFVLDHCTNHLSAVREIYSETLFWTCAVVSGLDRLHQPFISLQASDLPVTVTRRPWSPS